MMLRTLRAFFSVFATVWRIARIEAKAKGALKKWELAQYQEILDRLRHPEKYRGK